MKQGVIQKKGEKFIHRVLHLLEFAIAILTLAVLVGMLGVEIFKMFTVEGYFTSVDNYLHNILTIVVGLEFVRMLTDLTPANTIEVLRHVILSHDDPLSNLACVACIAGLFATRRFLIPKQEMNRELSEVEEYSE